jgi:predicted membrane-bound spermidine synthase
MRTARSRPSGPDRARAWVRDLLLLLVAIVAAGGCAYYYVVAVLDGQRALSRSAVLAFFVFSLIVAVYIRRVLW